MFYIHVQSVSLIVEFCPDLVKGGFFYITDLFLKSFAMSSSCINPFLYGWLNDNFKREICSLFGNPKRKRKRNKKNSLIDINRPQATENLQTFAMDNISYGINV